jgi:alkylation response protein AidB-like acyl-CoA dehydrogenase
LAGPKSWYLGYGPIEQQIFVNEAHRADAVACGDAVDRRADLAEVRQRGAEEEVPAGILSGDVHFAIGYTEPEAGTDLASCEPVPFGMATSTS